MAIQGASSMEAILRRAAGIGAAAAAIAIALFLPAAQAQAPPDTVIDSGPDASTNQTAATLTFHAVPGSGSTFECARDTPVNWFTCTSPRTTTGVLSEGAHAYFVRAINGGQTDATPAEYHWTVDLTAPSTNVTGRPAALTNGRTATFAFDSPDSTATFRCSLDLAPATACASPLVYHGLSDASRSILIQAVDQAGNVDSNAQAISWTTDATPPDTTITAHPDNPSRLQDPTFSFTSTEHGSTFRCFITGMASMGSDSCTTGQDFSGLVSGNHEIRVRAVDPAGNVDPDPAVYAWTVDAKPPPAVQRVALIPKAGVAGSTSRVSATVPPLIPVTPLTSPLPAKTPDVSLGDGFRAQWLPVKEPGVRYVVRTSIHQADTDGSYFLTSFEWFDQLGGPSEQLVTHKTAVAIAASEEGGYPYMACVSVQAVDAVGNVSKPRESCTQLPAVTTSLSDSSHSKRVTNKHAYHGYYLTGGPGDWGPFPTGYTSARKPRKLIVIAAKCPTCGSIGIATWKSGESANESKWRSHLVRTIHTRSQKTSYGNVFKIAIPANVHPAVVAFRSGHPRLEGYGFARGPQLPIPAVTPDEVAGLPVSH
jgi:hypothetical protein